MRPGHCLVAVVVLALGWSGSSSPLLQVEDLRVPATCTNRAETGDHLMIKYEVKQSQTGEDVFKYPRDQSFHMVLGEDDVVDGLNIGLQRMCEGGVRRVTIPPAYGYPARDFDVGPPMTGTRRIDPSASLDFYVTLENVTKAEEYEIFTALSGRNMSQVLDLIESKKGINAVDQFGATPLMIAVSSGIEVLVATLLNSWRPRVNVNARKPSGYSALVYAAANPKGPSIVRALLQRGADPNAVIETGENRGYSPLHFAVQFGALRNALSLLEYGANPTLPAADGSTPLDLARRLPRESGSDRDKLVAMLTEATNKWRGATATATRPAAAAANSSQQAKDAAGSRPASSSSAAAAAAAGEL